MKCIAALLPLIASASAQAHDGHSAPGLHLHGSDLLGLFVLLAATAVALWIWRTGGGDE